MSDKHIRLQQLMNEMSKIAEHDAPTREQERRFNQLQREYDEVDAERRDEERARVRSVAADHGFGRIESGARSADEGYDRDAFGAPESIDDPPRRYSNPWDLAEVRTFGRDRHQVAAELRARAVSAIERMSSANDTIRQAATVIVERFDDKDATLARTALAGSSPAYLRAFAKAATGRQAELTEAEARAVGEVRALSLTDSAGGYLVPFQLDPTVIVTANGSLNDIRRVARQVVATGDVWNGVTAGAVAWSWDAEASEVSDDSPTFAQPSIPVHKAAGFVPVSIEALQDMANGAAEIARLLAEGRDTLESAAFVLGSGSGQPTGVVTGLASTPSSVVAAVTPDTLAVADLYGIQNALPARYRRNASWLATNGFFNRARQFDTNGGGALWAQLGDDRPSQLLGKPIYEAEDMDGVINSGADNFMAVFGDFSNYVIADRIGMTVEFVPTLFGPNRRPTGQRGWHAWYRTGAAVVNPAGLRVLNV